MSNDHLYFPSQAARSTSTDVLGLRKSLKSHLPTGRASSVQFEVEDLPRQGGAARVFFRVVLLPEDARRGRADQALARHRPTYLVHYLGEPYFYSDAESPDPEICQVTPFLDPFHCASF